MAQSREQKPIYTERTFQVDTINMTFLDAELVWMTKAIGFELRKQHKLTGCVTVKLRYSNFDTKVKQRAIDYISADGVLLRVAQELFEKLYEDTQEMVNFYQAIDSVKRQFGEGLVKRAVGVQK